MRNRSHGVRERRKDNQLFSKLTQRCTLANTLDGTPPQRSDRACCPAREQIPGFRQSGRVPDPLVHGIHGNHVCSTGSDVRRRRQL